MGGCREGWRRGQDKIVKREEEGGRNRRGRKWEIVGKKMERYLMKEEEKKEKKGAGEEKIKEK